MHNKGRFFIVIILTIVLLILGACKAEPAETVTMTVTQPAKTETQSASTITQPAATITKTVTTTIGQTQTSTSTTSTVISTTSTKTSTTKTTIIPPGATAITNYQFTVITPVSSPDGKVQISQYTMANISQSIWQITGIVKNNNSSTVSVEVKLYVYDRDGQLVEIVAVVIENLESGQSMQFAGTTTASYFMLSSYKLEISVVS